MPKAKAHIKYVPLSIAVWTAREATKRTSND